MIRLHLIRFKLLLFRLRHLLKRRFKCPVCTYAGPFIDLSAPTGLRENAKCPSCGSMERHRLQKLVLDRLSTSYEYKKCRILHVAPEKILKDYFTKVMSGYVSMDLYMKNVMVRGDITRIPLADNTFNAVFASHVLEHIQKDDVALAEVKRILNPGGIVILPVPIIGYETIEYPAPNPYEADHVRAPGIDYFERYRQYFPSVRVYSSDDFPGIYQTYIHEDRSCLPTEKMPHRKPMAGNRHPDYVPVCMI